MNTENGNIYGPGDPVPEGVELTEIDKSHFDALKAERVKDIAEAMRRQAQGPRSQGNPGR